MYFPFHLRHLKPVKKSSGYMKSVTTMHIYLFWVAIAAIIVEKLRKQCILLCTCAESLSGVETRFLIKRKNSSYCNKSSASKLMREQNIREKVVNIDNQKKKNIFRPPKKLDFSRVTPWSSGYG